jgi:predicted KAP-like P-loop ATPase
MSTLSADRPSDNPSDDLFGHAPFAKALCDSIHRYRAAEGLVLALYGPWGSGKSTVLSYVIHYLNQHPSHHQPVVVTFNPWWFSGQDNLARAFLGQLQAVLPGKSDKFLQIGQYLGEFAEGLGGLIDLTGTTAGVGGIFGKVIGKVTKRKPKDIPVLKGKISKLLMEADKRVLVVVDDIDRLTAEETRQLFTVIKAVADFPNIIYLLAFDREVAAQAIQEAGLPGDRYLEKIIQVPFELPAVDRDDLRKLLFRRLDVALQNTPDGLFDESYWTNVFFDGLDKLFKVPRDVIRFTNTASVTYPAVRGEVNPVDFIALEALRVFLPSLYDTIRHNSDNFAGHRSTNYSDKHLEEFKKAVLHDVPEQIR